jgi:hypothetical protein
MRRTIYLASAWTLIFTGLAWTRVNKPYESYVLVTVTHNHGLTDVDLPSVAAVLVAVALLWKARTLPRRG